MVDNEKTFSVPALDRGLSILEFLARRREGITFQEILDTLDLPKASAARLLGVLREHRFVNKQAGTGRYVLGPSIALMGRRVSSVEELRMAGKSVLQSLRDQTGNSSILLHWTGREVLCLDKEIAPAAVSMRKVDSVGNDMEIAPWSWVLWTFLDDTDRAEAMKRAEEKTQFRRTIHTQSAFFVKHGYAYDDEQCIKHVRRMAAPIFDIDGQVVACLAVGGNLLTLPDEKVESVGQSLLKHAKELTLAISGQWRDAKNG